MENPVLHSALDKIREHGGDGSGLDGEEVRALAEYLNLLVAKEPKTESDQLLSRHIRQILHQRAVATRAVEEPENYEGKRTNLVLRAAIDKFLQRSFADISEDQVTLLRDVQMQLLAMAQSSAPSANETRLQGLVTQCLSQYENWLRDSADAPESV